jgi:hypothetical protein
MKNTEFHKPFIKNLAFLGLVTIVSMISAHYFFNYVLVLPSNSSNYKSQQSHIQTNGGE